MFGPVEAWVVLTGLLSIAAVKFPGTVATGLVLLLIQMTKATSVSSEKSMFFVILWQSLLDLYIGHTKINCSVASLEWKYWSIGLFCLECFDIHRM